MISYKDKKWLILQPVYGGKWDIPDANLPWTNDCNIGLGRLLQASGNHFSNNDIDMSCDIYYMIIFNVDHYEKELELIKKLKSLNKKVILTFSADMRFLTGEGLLGHTGINYTDLCAEADLIISGVPEHIRFYGRYQHKVISMGVFLERLNFHNEGIEKDIDILMTGSIFRNEPSLSFGLELMCLLKEKYPDKRIVYPTKHKELLAPKYSQLDLIDADAYMYSTGLVPLLQRTKIYINPELRPNPGRAMIEAFYCRVPYICSSMSYPSKWMPDFTYDCMDFNKILEQYDKVINTDTNWIIKKAETLVEDDYFDKAIQKIMNRLYPE
jgi:hypothetical protein